MQGNPQTEIWEFVACGIRNDGIDLESRILNSSNPESHEPLEMESKFCRQGIGIRRGTALGGNVDPIYNKAKS